MSILAGRGHTRAVDVAPSIRAGVWITVLHDVHRVDVVNARLPVHDIFNSIDKALVIFLLELSNL